MRSHQILPREVIKEEIRKSHERSRRYDIDPDCLVNPHQIRLSPKELELRLKCNQTFLDIAVRQLNHLYEICGDGFAMILADREGYLLYIVGDQPMLKRLAEINCAPGFRWTERDVGTTTTALAIARKIPIQITEKESFCRRGRGYTNSAAPIFGVDDDLLGAVIATGDADRVHAHTLGMMINAARSIENELDLLKKGDELLIQNRSMKAVLESIDSGLIVTNRDGVIVELNNSGVAILRGYDVRGLSIQDLVPTGLDWASLLRSDGECIDREFFFQIPDGETIHVMATIRLIKALEGEIGGYVIKLDEIGRIRKLVNKMAGSQAIFTLNDIIGVSPAIQHAKGLAMKAARSQSSVLITGETGTGKELFAQAIHNQSDRSRRPFVVINCGAIPRELLESELFGYVEGSFTGAAKGGRPGKFELANGGTIFLDEMGDMPMDMQVKLLRVLQSGEIFRIGEHRPHLADVRIIAATNVDINQAQMTGGFRPDLYYRLNVLPITILPLRKRPEDIMPLAQYFLERRRGPNTPIKGFTSEAVQSLMSYNWPGNVRELENVIERLLNIVDEPHIRAEHLGFLRGGFKRALKADQSEDMLSEMETIREVMSSMGHNIAKASRVLGISRPTLYKKLKKYNLDFKVSAARR
jgi:transcriptional regulator with PAS, ATPase and Fis domain